MSRVSMFSSPLLLGFDQLERTLERLAKNAEGYPPYNIERIGDNGLRITLAVAGFTSDDLAIELVENQLSVRGKQTDDTDRVYLHRGIAARQFQRAFMLADGIEVIGARLDNGLLSIDLVRPQAEPRIRTIRIDSGTQARCGQDDRHHRAPHWLALNAAKEVAMENNQTTTPVFTPLADDAFLSLGTQQIAYIKSVDLPDGAHAVAIFSADGQPMAAAAAVEIAQALIRQHELEPALVH